MPKATVKEESAYSLPEDVLLPAQLLSVTEEEIPYTIKSGKRAGEQGTFRKWTWEFKITDGEYAGLHAWGATEAGLSTLDEPKGSLKLAKPWSETLLNTELPVGYELDTDDLLGLPCQITVSHDEPRAKKDGGYFYGCPVEDVFPAKGQISGDGSFVPY